LDEEGTTPKVKKKKNSAKNGEVTVFSEEEKKAMSLKGIGLLRKKVENKGKSGSNLSREDGDCFPRGSGGEELKSTEFNSIQMTNKRAPPFQEGVPLGKLWVQKSLKKGNSSKRWQHEGTEGSRETGQGNLFCRVETRYEA